MDCMTGFEGTDSVNADYNFQPTNLDNLSANQQRNIHLDQLPSVPLTSKKRSPDLMTLKPEPAPWSRFILFKLFSTTVELITLLGTYKKIQALHSFKLIAITSTTLKEHLDGAWGVSELLDVAGKIKRANSLDLLFQHLPLAFLACADIQTIFSRCKPDLSALTLGFPFSTGSKLLQMNIAPKHLFTAGFIYGAANIWKNFRILKRKNINSFDLHEKVQKSLAKVRIIKDFTSILYYCLNLKSSTPSWMKFALLATSTGAAVYAEYCERSKDSRNGRRAQFQPFYLHPYVDNTPEY